MNKNSRISKGIALCFVIFLFAFCLKSGSPEILRRCGIDLLTAGRQETLNAIETDFAEGLWGQRRFIDLNGSMARLLNIRGYYSSQGIYMTEDRVTTNRYDETSTDYEFEALSSFSSFLAENDIQLLYVNEPTKYLDDSVFLKEFGLESYVNRNADRLIARLREAGIPTVDLRESIAAEGLDISEMFYRTDHHWTVPAGFWAASRIAAGLNDLCGYSIDLSLYDPERFTTQSWENCWLGEQGRKVALTYAGLDDFTCMEPSYETKYTFLTKNGDTDVEDDFSHFILESTYNTEVDVYESPSWHYSYQQIHCINQEVPEGKILLLGDSYEQITEPFLSLGVHEVKPMILRQVSSDFDLKGYILENGFDTVVIAYAPFMIGAHDDPQSANYRMFSFDR